MDIRPTIIRNPPNDREFERAIMDMVESGVVDPIVAEGLLRERYPLAIVRPRGLDGEQTPAWYVYRDGKWIPER